MTTFEEGVEIINVTIANAKNDPAAVETYGVSYQQVYSWVRQFEKDGSQGLLDRRGKWFESKPNLTEGEELRLNIKQLEEHHRYLEMENSLLAVSCCQSCRHLVPNVWTSLAGLSVTRFALNG